MASREPRADNGGRWNSVDSARGKKFSKKEKPSETEEDFVETEESKKKKGKKEKKKKKSEEKTMEQNEPKNLGAAAAQKEENKTEGEDVTEISESERNEKLRKFSGNINNPAIGGVGIAAEVGVAGATKIDEVQITPEKNGDVKSVSRETDASKTTKDKGEKKSETKTFHEELDFLKQKQLKILAEIQSGSLEIAYFEDLNFYLSEIRDFYKHEEKNIENFTELNRKRAQSEYENTKKEIENKWKESRNLFIERVKTYINEEVDRKIKKLESDKENGMLSSDIETYIALLTNVNRAHMKHLVPASKEMKNEIAAHMRVSRNKIKEVYRAALEGLDMKIEKFGLPDEVIGLFKDSVQRVLNFWLLKLEGKEGFLESFGSDLRSEVVNALKNEFVKNEDRLAGKYKLAADKRREFVEYIVDLVMKNKK